MSLIYSITNAINGKRYIGQTIRSLEQRWYDHCYDAENSNKNFHFYKAIRKYGHENFMIETIEEISDTSLLDEREIYWIAFYNTFNNGYNSTIGGGGNKGYKHSDEIREKIKKNQTGRSPSQNTREKMRQKKIGRSPWNKGKKGVQVAWNKGIVTNKERDDKGKFTTRYLSA